MPRLIDLPGEPGEENDPLEHPGSAGPSTSGEPWAANHRSAGAAPPAARSTQAGAPPTAPPPSEAIWPSRLRRGHVAGIAALLLIAVAGACVLLIRHRPVTEPLPVSSLAASPAGPARASPPGAQGGPLPRESAVSGPGATVRASPAVLLVHVAGKVRDPGVVELRPGDRVLDALEACGGPRRGVDLSTLNLARPVADGEQILVGIRRPAVPGPPVRQGTGPSGVTAPPTPLDLNHATPEQLEELPGIGPVLARRIAETRDERGGFHAVEELLEVSGIAERRFAELRDKVTVG